MDNTELPPDEDADKVLFVAQAIAARLYGKRFGWDDLMPTVQSAHRQNARVAIEACRQWDTQLREARKAHGRGLRYGREVGAISRNWRRVLRRMYNDGTMHVFTLADISAMATAEGINVLGDSVQARLNSYAMQGYVERVRQPNLELFSYRLLPKAVQRFGFGSHSHDQP